MKGKSHTKQAMDMMAKGGGLKGYMKGGDVTDPLRKAQSGDEIPTFVVNNPEKVKGPSITAKKADRKVSKGKGKISTKHNNWGPEKVYNKTKKGKDSSIEGWSVHKPTKTKTIK